VRINEQTPFVQPELTTKQTTSQVRVLNINLDMVKQTTRMTIDGKASLRS